MNIIDSSRITIKKRSWKMQKFTLLLRKLTKAKEKIWKSMPGHMHITHSRLSPLVAEQTKWKLRRKKMNKNFRYSISCIIPSFLSFSNVICFHINPVRGTNIAIVKSEMRYDFCTETTRIYYNIHHR